MVCLVILVLILASCKAVEDVEGQNSSQSLASVSSEEEQSRSQSEEERSLRSDSTEESIAIESLSSPDASALESPITGEEIIALVVKQYYHALKTGDAVQIDKLYQDGLFAPDENVEERIREEKAYADAYIVDVDIKNMDIAIKPGEGEASVNVTYDYVMSEEGVDRLFVDIHNITYDTWDMAKVGGEWKIQGLADRETDQQRQTRIAYAPVMALWDYLHEVFSGDEHGGMSIVDNSTHEQQNGYYAPFRFTLVVWVVDRSAIDKAMSAYTGDSVDVVYKDALFSSNQLVQMYHEIEGSSIRQYLENIGVDSDNNKVSVFIKDKKYEDKVVAFLKNFHGGKGVSYEVGPVTSGENPLT